MSVVSLLCRVLVSAVLLFAAVAKLLSWASATRGVDDYWLLMIAGGEVLLAAGLWTRRRYFVAVALLGVLPIAGVVALAVPPQTRCGCFGDVWNPTDVQRLVVIGCLGLLLLIDLQCSTHAASSRSLSSCITS